VAQRLGRDNFHRYLREFGFGAPTGIELPGESSGLLRPPGKWSALSLASLSFGQEVGVTALQMALAMGAVANGGDLMKPILVRQVEDALGRVARRSRPAVARRVLRPETVDTLTEILKAVVESGTGQKARIAGYRVAGKTGTAQKVDPSGRYSMLDHVASFVGFVPASRPALVVLVSLDTPRGERNEGGDVAAPVFARVAEGALRRLAVPPDDADRVLRPLPYRPEVTRAAYQPGAASDAPTVSSIEDPTLMPDLRGLPAREAALIAARRGLIVELQGSGRVVAQLPEPGTEVETGLSCLLRLSQGP
jgi:cell division protein FtsI (penicillin-binding protein 3)